MSESSNLGTHSRAVITWMVNGIKHDHVERFYTDSEGKLGVQCGANCCCRK